MMHSEHGEPPPMPRPPDPPESTPAAPTPADKDRRAAAEAALRGMSALELEPEEEEEEEEMEMESLVVTDMEYGVTTSRRQRQRTSGSRLAGSGTALFSRMYAALPERNQNFSLRNLLLLGGLGGLTFMFVDNAEQILELFSTTSDVDESAGYTPTSPHDSSFGGINNLAHPAGAKAAADGAFDDEEIFIPVSNVGHAVQSMSAENVLNYYGHYVHDEHRSPFSSHLYDRPKEELEAEQTRHENKMVKVREEYGAWNFTDPSWDRAAQGERPTADFSKTPYKDLPTSAFPDGAWQNDREYVDRFIAEAKALVDRMLEGIYAEYGQPTKKADGTMMTDAERAARDAQFSVKHVDGAPNGIAQMSAKTWDGLVRKLLHAMMTHDEFYVVLGGHSSAAGHGNNFWQTKMMNFQYVMEPVFDKLGMRLLSRNSAQGGVGTTHSAFAGASIYGEMDIHFWDSSMTEKDPGAHDTFNKQAILGGERVPVIFNCPPVNIMAETNGTAWIGSAGAALPIPMETSSEEQVKTVPWAIRYMKCGARKDLCEANKYNSICWEPRKDITPTKMPQAGAVGGRAGWHPGDRTHKMAARVWCLLVLHALNGALDRWKDGIENDSFPLPESYWHIGEVYKTIQENLRTHVNSKPLEVKEGEPDLRSQCERKWSRYPRVCRVAMHAFGEWTPRANPDFSSLRSIIKPAPNGYKPYIPIEEEYSGIDLLPYDHAPSFPRIPDGEVDVHAIAIATTKPPPDLDHSLADDGEQRRLAEISAEVMKERTIKAKQAFREKLTRDKRSRSLQPSSVGTRDLDENEVVPGQGWNFDKNVIVTGYCDGTLNSHCGRNKGHACLMTAHNDGRANYEGDALSGWLVMKIPKVKEGIILIRMEWWHTNSANKRTEGWTEVNNGKTHDTTPFFTSAPTTAPTAAPKKEGATSGAGEGNSTARNLLMEGVDGMGRTLKTVGPIPDDFQFDYAINGKIVKTQSKEEWTKYGNEIVKNFALWPVLDDAEWAKRDWGDSDGEDVEVGVRMRSKVGRGVTIGLSHVYYA